MRPKATLLSRCSHLRSPRDYDDTKTLTSCITNICLSNADGAFGDSKELREGIDIPSNNSLPPDLSFQKPGNSGLPPGLSFERPQ